MKRGTKELLHIALRDGSVRMTLEEARQFLVANRHRLQSLPVEFMVQGYGGDNCDEPTCQGEEGCICFVGGHEEDDIEMFLDEETLSDYPAFELWHRDG
jgi:hypothetical protein